MMDEAIERAIEQYNRYHAPEAKAKLIEFNGRRLKVSIKGPFCATCGVVDWLEDLKYEIEALGVRNRMVSFERAGEDEFIAIYELVNEQ